MTEGRAAVSTAIGTPPGRGKARGKKLPNRPLQRTAAGRRRTLRWAEKSIALTEKTFP